MLKKIILIVPLILTFNSCEIEDSIDYDNSNRNEELVLNSQTNSKFSENSTCVIIGYGVPSTFIYKYISGPNIGKYVTSFDDAFNIRIHYSFVKPDHYLIPSPVNIKFNSIENYYYEENWRIAIFDGCGYPGGGDEETDLSPEDIK